MRHVVIMTFTSALGLMAMFLVDLADLFFLSLLNQTEVAAAGTGPSAPQGPVRR